MGTRTQPQSKGAKTTGPCKRYREEPQNKTKKKEKLKGNYELGVSKHAQGWHGMESARRRRSTDAVIKETQKRDRERRSKSSCSKFIHPLRESWMNVLSTV